MSKVGGDSKNTLYCSFCGKSQHDVRKLIAGPTVFICDECVELCTDIIREENKSSLVKSRDGTPTPKEIRKVRFSTSVTIFGGFAPFVATWLIAQTGDPLSPSYYLMATALLSIVALMAILRRQPRTAS